MKLLIYSHFFAPSIGGVETLVFSLAHGLSQLSAADGQRQFEVTLVTQTPAGHYDDRPLPFPVIRQPTPALLWGLIRSTEVLHVAGTALLPMLFGRLARKPMVVEHHGFQSICPNGQLLIEPAGTPCPGHFMAGRYNKCLRCNAGSGRLASLKLWLLTFLRRFLCAGVAANITPTQWLGGLIQLPNVVAIAHGLEDSGERGAAQWPDPPVIGFLGRLVSTKGVGTLLAAVDILRRQQKRFRVLIVGDGPERAALEKQADDQQLGEMVQFAGRLRADELRTAMAEVSIAVVPSLGGEVFGLVVAENMLRGLPVVASNLGALTEVLGDAGLTFETGNAQALAGQLARLLDDAGLRAELGRQAHQRAAALCDMQRMLEGHARVYRAGPGNVANSHSQE
jgi:glycosyltransferase involved in cell wall biosynthesis